MATMERERITGPFKERYFIRAAAWFKTKLVGLPSVVATAEVFDGDPRVPGAVSVARVAGDRFVDELWDGLENAERVARDVIERLP
ncbi:hypothetical protein M1D55_19565 [Cupriavidus sp. JZ107]